MENKTVRIASHVIILIAVFLFGWNLGAQKASKTVADSIDFSSEETNEQYVSLMIDSGEGEIVVASNMPLINDEMSVFDFIFELYGDQLQYKDFGGDLGIFIEKINGVGGDGSNKWWQYWVNNEYSMIGVSSYFPKSGDVIMIKYTDQQTREIK